MSGVDPRLVTAMRKQLRRRPAGAARVGWKVGSGESERIGDSIAVGHLGVAFGPLVERSPTQVEGRLVVNGVPSDGAAAPGDIEERVAAVARVLAAVGEELRAGDRVITGLIVQVPVSSGDHVVANVAPLGAEPSG